MIYRILTFFSVSFFASSGLLHSQEVETLKIENISLEISNVRVVSARTTIGYPEGRHPVNPVILDKEKLLPPETTFHIVFDYKRTAIPGNGPNEIVSVCLDASVAPQPIFLREEKGSADIWLSHVFADENKVVDVETSLNFYGFKEGNQKVPSTGKIRPVKFTARMDRYVQISETQFDALKALYFKVQELEKRIKNLESIVPK